TAAGGMGLIEPYLGMPILSDLGFVEPKAFRKSIEEMVRNPTEAWPWQLWPAIAIAVYLTKALKVRAHGYNCCVHGGLRRCGCLGAGGAGRHQRRIPDRSSGWRGDCGGARFRIGAGNPRGNPDEMKDFQENRRSADRREVSPRPRPRALASSEGGIDLARIGR